MADWVHCNQCFRQPGDGRKYSLTNCGHTYCQNCLDAGNKKICSLCKKPCSTILLTSKMIPDVEKFFCDPADLVKRHQSELAQVMSFQKSHRQRLTSFNRQQLAKQAECLKRAEKMMERYKELEKQHQKLLEENAYLKKLIGRMGGNQSGRSPTNHDGRVHGGMVLSQRSLSQGASPSTISNSSYPSQGHRSKSPYSEDTRRYSPQESAQQSKRLSIRPAPVRGKIGTPGSSSPSPMQMVTYAGGTPGPHVADLPHSRSPNSPMSISPSNCKVVPTGKTPNVPISGKVGTPVSVAMFASPPVSQIQLENSLSRRLSAVGSVK